MTWKEFEDFAREKMSQHFGTKLLKCEKGQFCKQFDMVSADATVLGDAKFLTLVHGIRIPPAKFMEIAGHVWMLQVSPAQRRFLVFGNQRDVPREWLQRYCRLVRDVEFYFLAADGELERL
jgi:hypothetical protein